MKKRTQIIIGIILTCLTVSVAYGTTPESKKYGGVYKEVLRVGPATPIGYPPEAAPDATALGAIAYEALLRVMKGGALEPVLATSWKIERENKSVTFELRRGVKFHDGSRLTAQAVKWNFDRLIKAKKVRGWKDVEVIDEYTVRVRLDRYMNTVLTSFRNAYVISPESVEKNGLEWARWHPVGTGPFKFVEYERDARLVFERNPDYWQKNRPYLDGIELDVVADAMVQKLAFKRGDIHSLIALGLIAQELKLGGENYYSEPGGTFLLIPDSGNADSPLKNKKVRMAIAHAINREAISAALGFGFGRPAYQVYPGFKEAKVDTLQTYEYNPEKARKLLVEAGYPDGFKTTIHTFVRQIPQDHIKAIANMLNEIGITTKPDFPEGGKYSEYRFKGWKNGMMAHGFAAMDNLNSAFSFYFGGIQFPSIEKTAEWTELFEDSLYSDFVEPQKLQALIGYMNDEAMIIPYYEEVIARFYQDGVHLFDPDKYRLNFPVYTNIWLEPKVR